MRVRWFCSWPMLGRSFLFVALACLMSPPSIADSFDWRNVDGQNWLSPVRDQFGGTCWDFAACGVIEAKYMLTRNDTSYSPDISEQQVNWETNPDMGDMVDGGQAYQVLEYVTNHGIVLESECPVQGTDVGAPPYWPLASGWQNRVFRATSNAQRLSEGTDNNYIKNCLRTMGPLTIHMEADNDWYSPPPGANRGGHQVVIVGYQDDAAAPGGGYWIVKNSWGEWWNGDGYGTIAYASQPSYEDWSWIWIYNRDVNGLNGAVYYTGAMASVNWGGGSGTWSQWGGNWSGYDQYGNYLPSFAWDNSEINATFYASAGTNITLDGKVVAHGVTIASGATGYVFNGANGGSLTVTGSGITAHESVAINAPVWIGATQSWTIDSGKSLTINGDLHTIISPLTINGNGDTTVTGSINGGGVLNQMGVAPGAITKTGTGALHLTGAASYTVPLNATGTLSFEQNGPDCAGYWSNISGSAEVQKYNSGLIILGGSNSYSGLTRIFGGAVQANVNQGIPNQSAVILQGGVLQSNSAVTFTDSFWAEVPDYRCVSWWGGGFAGGGGKMTVNLRGNGSTVSWTGNGDTGIAGDITLSSTTAQYEVEIVNALNLAGEERTIYVEDNTYSTGDFARISGNITGGDYDPGNGTGIHYGGIVKTGPGLLILSGAGNSYGDNNGDRGRTIIAAGVLQGNVPTASTIQLDGGVYQSSGTMTRGWYDEWYGNNITWNNGGFSAAGGKLTVNIDGDARTIYWTGNGHNGIGGTMILSSAFADSEVEIANPIDMYGGVRTIQVNDNPNSNGDFATLSGGLTNGGLIKTGPGQLQLVGPNVSYTGGTTISAGRLTLKDTTNFAGPVVNGGTLEINAATTDIVLAGNISNGAAVGEVIKNGPGKVTLTGANTYGDNVGWTGYTTVNQGVLQADRGVGLPAGSCLVLNGGVLQSNGVSTFNTGFWYDWGFLAWVNGGFAAGGGKLTVNLYGDSRTLNWGTDGYSTLAGNMVLGSNSAQYETEIQNGINLNGGARSIRVDDNPNTTGDFANLSGVLNDSVGGGSLTVTGAGTLRISGASGNTYSGATYLQGGNVELAKSAGYAVPGNLYLGGANSYFVSLLGNNQIAPTATVTWNSTGGWQEVKLLGHTLTVAGISDTSGRGVIENTWDETGYGTATLTVNNSASCSFNGYIRNQAFSGNTPLALVKNGSGTLTLSGPNTGGYTGGLTVNAGTLDYSGGTLPACPYTINGGTLNIGALSKSIGTFTITGGTVSGTGALTSSAAYNVQGGTVSAVLAGTVGLTKTGTGRTTLNGTNTYTGTTTVSAGVLQANNAAGLPNASFLSLNGGVLQANGTSTVTFTRGVATSGAGKFAWGTSGGGFAAGTAAMNVNVGGAGATVTWGTSGNVIKGTLKLGSTTSANVTTFQNPIALGSSTRTVQVDDNTGSTADYAVLSGAISGTGGLTKTGTGKLVLSNTGSSYTGTTTVSAGILAAVGASIDGPIAVNSGGTFSPGNSVGSVTTGAATWNSGGKYMFEIFSATGTAGTQWDLWNITGNLTDTSPFTVSAITESSNGVPGLMTNFVNTNSYTWTIASTTGTMPSNLISLLTLDSSGFQGMASTGRIYLTEAANYKTLYLNYAPTGGTGHAFTPVPEPGSIILLLTLAMPLGLGLYVKRRRS